MTVDIFLKIYLLLGALLFVGGLFIVATRRNIILVLVGIELMLNASMVNLVAFNRFIPEQDGHVMVLFIILVAAASVSVALALALKIWKQKSTSNLDEYNTLKG
jgi:NADH:ubiquinone oxidoreductase subunit K